MRRIRIFTAVGLLLAAMIAIIPAAATAAPGGKGGGTSESCSGPTLEGPVSANVGDTYTVRGCGFEAYARVALTIGEAGGCCAGELVGADAEGTFSYSRPVWGAGDYVVKAAVQRNNGRWRVVAEWRFTAS